MDKKTDKELREILWRNRARRRDMFPQLIERVCRHYQVTEEELRGRSRKSEFVEPRQMIFYIAHNYYRIPCEEVGKRFNRHHTNVIYANRKYEDYLDLGIDKEFRRLVNKFIID